MLCDESNPCRVRSDGWKIQVCLPNTSATLCEPYGEVWQQVGAPIADYTRDGCSSFDLRALSIWYRRLRERGSPFFAQPPRDAGRNYNAAAAFALDERITGESFSKYKPVREAEFRQVEHLGRTRPPPLTGSEQEKRDVLVTGMGPKPCCPTPAQPMRVSQTLTLLVPPLGANWPPPNHQLTHAPVLATS